MESNALALMGSTAGTALLGVAFWAVAARMYTPADVGRASALISAATLLATLAQLNLGNVYGRFLHSAGGHQRRLVFAGYGAVTALGLVLGVGYALLVSDVLWDDVWERWLFPICVATLAVFALHDMIMISIRRAAWVPVKNLAFGVAKLVLLAVLASSLPTTGINVSWMVPALIAVLIVTGFLARPSVLAGRKQALGTLPSRRMLGETVVGEYVTGLASTAVPLLLPILVVSRLGVEANAYFALPWLISTSLSLMLWNIASSLLVHASESGQSDQFSFLIRRALKLAVLIGAAGAAAVWVLGPMLMSLLGSAYAENSTWLLRLVALAAPSSAVIVVWTTAARVRHRLKQVIALQVCIGVSVLGLSTVLVGEMGIVGIGVAYLATQTVAALVLLRPLWAIVRRDPAANFAAPAAPAETVPDHAAPDQSALTLDGAPR
jgi:O-antigen/teichoic acid export membrane protein